ncbi:MAG: phosphoribosyltransferase family protein [Candidatus Saccharimonadales bacterium]
MNTVTHTLHHLSLVGEHLTVDPTSYNLHFNDQAYSLFKHGDGISTEHYSDQLANLLTDREAIKPDEPVYISGSAYQFVPTAAAHLAVSLTATLQNMGYNATHFRTHNNSITTKSNIPTGDFSGMDMAQRQVVMAANKPHLDADDQRMIEGAKVITVDDIRMTGAHEETLAELLTRADVDTTLFCYLAVFDPKQGAENARLEREINQRHMPSLARLAEIACDQSFLPNARISRFVLQAATEDLNIFAETIPPHRLAKLVSNMEADNYDQNPKYIAKLSILRDILQIA